MNMVASATFKQMNGKSLIICDLLYKFLQILKGISGRKLFERYPELRQKLWKGELWNHSYYVETVGSVSEENIRRYIEHQSKSY